MSYLPTPEKLQALGFTQRDIRKCAFPTVTWRDSNRHQIKVYTDGDVFLTYFGSIDDEEYTSFAGACPSEAFFDQLLVAVGWQPSPDATPSA